MCNFPFLNHVIFKGVFTLLLNPKGSKPWIFFGRADAEAPILWPPDAKSWLIGKDPYAGKDWRKENKGMTEQLNNTLFFFFIYFYWLEASYFTTFQWGLSYIDMNQPWSYMYSPSRSPLPPPTPPVSSGSSQGTRPEHLSHASHLGWWSGSL